MTIDDADSAEHNGEYEESFDGKLSRRGRLKDALNRTKTKISKVKEERDARKQKQEQEGPKLKLDNDVNDFLSAGRSSVASSHRPSVDTLAASPRPSTSESRSQPSPRRVLPISVPRIDVSASSRFPHAKEVDPDALVDQVGSSAISSADLQSNSLLKPAYKSRSQSATSIASSDRKARIRGLSVGFANVPPVIIGEGGEEAEAPPMEISRAKARARSASPQGRRPYADTTVQPEARKQMPARGISDNSAIARLPTGALLEEKATRSAPRGPHDDDLMPKLFPQMQTGALLDGSARDLVSTGSSESQFVPKPFARVQTGASMESNSSRSTPRGAYNDDFVPKPFARAQTGFSDGGSPHPIHRAPSFPEQPRAQGFVPLQLAEVQTGAMDLAKEFELTLGLGGSGSNSPATKKPQGNEAQIWAPKPKRAPPSYDLIEGAGKRHESNDQSTSPPPGHYQQNPPNQQPLQHQHSHGEDSPQQRQNSGMRPRDPVPQIQAFGPQKPQALPQKPPRTDVQPQTQRPLQSSMLLQPNQPNIHAQSVPQRPSQTSVQSLHQKSSQPEPKHLAQEYYPPPPQRTATQTARIPQRLERISPKPSHQTHGDRQEVRVVRDNIVAPATDAHSKLQLSLDTNNDGYRSFADRQKSNSRGDSFGTPTSGRKSPPTSTIRQVLPSNSYTKSPSNYSGSLQNTPQTAQGEPPPNKLRFYESMNRGNVPEGFL